MPAEMIKTTNNKWVRISSIKELRIVTEKSFLHKLFPQFVDENTNKPIRVVLDDGDPTYTIFECISIEEAEHFVADFIKRHKELIERGY